jgi:hypothetical protein
MEVSGYDCLPPLRVKRTPATMGWFRYWLPADPKRPNWSEVHRLPHEYTLRSLFSTLILLYVDEMVALTEIEVNKEFGIFLARWNNTNFTWCYLVPLVDS